jgi:hypothetical protein
VFNVAKTTRVAIRNRERFSPAGLPLASTSVEKRLQSRFLSRLGKMGHGGVIFLFFKQESFHFILFEGFVLAQHSHLFPPPHFFFCLVVLRLFFFFPFF